MTEKAPPPSATCDKFILRFHVDGLRKELKVRAASNERTLNAEILYLIKRGLDAERRGPAKSDREAEDEKTAA
ncbi:hypothetical protein C8245_21200 [Paracidovorax avenae]|uniref:Arc family DNA-binding protein n=1 Tax=Paracidovorax avenae TaxID=80867 RepID=UPI000D22949B|nr:Arc family DNA-binding protein [Paracidovorax avenae]AVS67851.1 hypothetical protein C8245_21200 [Paracidovorax avenae]